MTYSVKEIFYTLQGEGMHTGRAAVFMRFAGCNLWSGLERDRSKAICNFCDTDFIGTDGPGGGKFASAEDLARRAAQEWREKKTDDGKAFIVLTGGEPLLQVDTPLLQALKNVGFEIAVESNGTIKAPKGIDWLCISPKADAPLVQCSGNELKLVYPQKLAPPERFENLDFGAFFLQPMDEALDGSLFSRHIAAAIEYCQAHPKWRLSLQTHKIIGIP